MTGADLFARSLRAAGVTTIFSVSGNQILGLYEAAAGAGLRIVHTRHESAAAYAAAGWAEATGEAGIALVAGGPGFLASLVGVGVAASMELPVLLVSGGPPSAGDRPGAFQYLDQATIARAVCKATRKVEDANTIDRDVMRALGESCASIPGPVHLTVPLDVASHEIADRGPQIESPRELAPLSGHKEKTLDGIAAALTAAQRPLLIARPSANRGDARKALRELSARLGVRAVVMESPRGSEDLKYRPISRRYAQADYALVVGPADFTLHFLSQEHLARNGRVALIDAEGDPEPMRSLDAHLRLEPSRALQELARRVSGNRRTSWIASDAADEQQSAGAALHPFVVGKLMREMLPPEALLVLDGGEFCQWVRLAFASSEHEVIWNSRLGAIGGSIPLALGAALAQPDRQIAVAIGDGAFGYHGAELETAAREAANPIVIVGNDDRWGAEWHTQREKYGRAVATMLGTVNYDAVARGYGAQGYEADDERSFRQALSLARSADEPVCINVRIASVRSPATAP
jgi:acetolactate synthase-1/2/3 large subunit